MLSSKFVKSIHGFFLNHLRPFSLARAIGVNCGAHGIINTISKGNHDQPCKRILKCKDNMKIKLNKLVFIY